LLEECRAKKEALHPNSRRIAIDLEQIHPDWPAVQVPVASFYEAARPLVEETLAATEDLLARHRQSEFDVFYVTGGGSELPLVARVLRERFGRRVRRSAYTRSATAIGLAIQASQPDSYRLSERLSRFFGVWREAEAGTQITFDPLFAKGSHLPSAGEPPLLISRTYSPVHNVGHFRFLECSHRSEDGSPSGEIALWDEVRFPFDPELAEEQALESTDVHASSDAARNTIEEKYECDSSGCISVTITNKDVGYARTYRLGRWSREARAVAPARRRKKS
jgi:molecular chaperone DnaK (HSP70)